MVVFEIYWYIDIIDFLDAKSFSFHEISKH